jgi:glutathione S-transferase
MSAGESAAEARPLLVIGNKNYSSWSLRPWLLLRKAGVAFDELRIALDRPDTAVQIAQYSDAKRVPVLRDEGLTVWDSLAICEYAAERWPQVAGWPSERHARAMARSIACEMHSGFADLRSEMPMNCRARGRIVTASTAARADIDRVQSIWADCRRRWDFGGPWLFGEFGIADAMYVPVALRFMTYDVALRPDAEAYLHTVTADPAVREWLSAAAAESETLASDERGESASE